MADMIGKLERVELRDLWKHEEYDFSAWLAEEENLAMLANTIGIDMSLIEKESSVGGFSVDLYAEEQGTGKKIIIENQLEDTNHDHLGKIITYASGKDAKYIIWIVKHARDEHRQAIEWLNMHTDDDVNFFLLEIELWRIGDSLPAPKFNIVERPNDWAKEERRTTQLTDRDKFCLEFWQGFIDYASNQSAFMKEFKLRKAHKDSWFDVTIGMGQCFISLNVQNNKGTIDCGLYISDNKEFFGRMKTHKEEIEQLMGADTEWREATKACRIVRTIQLDTTNKANWETAYKWYIEMAPKVKKCGWLEK